MRQARSTLLRHHGLARLAPLKSQRTVFGALGTGSLIVAAIVAVPSLGATNSPVVFRVSISQQTVSYRGRSATLSIRMTTGGTSDTVAIGLAASSWPEPGVLGSPLTWNGERVSGAGRITGHFASGGLSAMSACFRGGSFDSGGGVDLSLPANSTTTLQYNVKLAAPPWPSVQMRLSADASIPAVSNDPAVIRYYQLGTRRFIARGPSGVHITLSALRTKTGSQPPVVIVARGKALLVSGHTNPRLNHQAIQVGYQQLPSGAQTLRRTIRGSIGQVTTDSHGTFHIAWRARHAGQYLITAAYRHPTRGLLSDRACDLTATVK